MRWLAFLSFARSQPIIVSSVYRFTALTPALARLEFAPGGIFDDRPTLAAFAPKQPLHLDAVAVNATTSKLSTNFSDPRALTIWITHGGAPAPFSAANLRVEGLSAGVRWDPSTAAPRNLNGTWVTSLDCYTDDPMDCMNQYEENGRNGPGWTYGLGEGLLTRDGFTLHDDTFSVRLVPPTPPSRIPWWSNLTLDAQDWYINIYGSDFARALRDWVVVLGPPALPPKTPSACGIAGTFRTASSSCWTTWWAATPRTTSPSPCSFLIWTGTVYPRTQVRLPLPPPTRPPHTPQNCAPTSAHPHRQP
jgi:hypothetical protein